MLKIGHTDYPQFPLFLAPMEDVTDIPFRTLCKELGADMIYTEFISSDGIIRGGKKGLAKLHFKDTERPLGIQIYGNDIETMVNAAKIAESVNPDLIDINFGCPVRKISNRGAGAGMLKDIPKMIEMTKRIVETVKVPVTVKTRLGWDTDSIVIEDVTEKLQQTGIAAITIHARTRSQLYSGTADWSYIRKVKDNPAINIPVIGNGDADTAEKIKQLFDEYKPDAIMVGRAAISSPWIFAEFKNLLKTGIYSPFSLQKKTEILKELLTRAIDFKGERAGILTSRRHLAVSFKTLPHIRELRIKLLTATTKPEVFQILDQIEEKYS